MTDTVFISSSNALGSFWTSKRYFDYLIDETSLPLLRGREFGQAVLICPSLWEGRRAIRRNEEAFISHVRQLIDILHEVKIERLTYVTSIDTQPETGNEDSPLVHEFEDAFLSGADSDAEAADAEDSMARRLNTYHELFLDEPDAGKWGNPATLGFTPEELLPP